MAVHPPPPLDEVTIDPAAALKSVRELRPPHLPSPVRERLGAFDPSEMLEVARAPIRAAGETLRAAGDAAREPGETVREIGETVRGAVRAPIHDAGDTVRDVARARMHDAGDTLREAVGRPRARRRIPTRLVFAGLVALVILGAVGWLVRRAATAEARADADPLDEQALERAVDEGLGSSISATGEHAAVGASSNGREHGKRRARAERSGAGGR